MLTKHNCHHIHYVATAQIAAVQCSMQLSIEQVASSRMLPPLWKTIGYCISLSLEFPLLPLAIPRYWIISQSTSSSFRTTHRQPQTDVSSSRQQTQDTEISNICREYKFVLTAS